VVSLFKVFLISGTLQVHHFLEPTTRVKVSKSLHEHCPTFAQQNVAIYYKSSEQLSPHCQTIPMPAQGDRSAPRFDPKQPRELCRYFSDLDFIFQRANVTADQSKKQHACRYADVNTSELWEALPAYTDDTKTYDEFKAEVLALYLGAEEERKWSVTDMDALIGERLRLGIISLSDLGDYYPQFLAITTFL
jgi:hypothetical protein